MNFIVENWQFLLLIVAVGFVIGFAIGNFFKLPTKEQLNKVKHWLLIAVKEAEDQFGSKTGQLKLSYVYDLFVAKFPWLAKIITFDRFSKLVDEVLTEFKDIIEKRMN